MNDRPGSATGLPSTLTTCCGSVTRASCDAQSLCCLSCTADWMSVSALRPEMKPGIDVVYSVLAAHGMTVFNTCTRWLDEVGTYSRQLDKDGQPTDKIADKESFHLLDCTRYVLSAIRRVSGRAKVLRLG